MKPLTLRLITVSTVLCLVSTSLLCFVTFDALAETDYNLTGETVNEGLSQNPTNRNAEDASYNTMKEADQYEDTNFSASSEDVTYGTAGGGAFPGSLDDDDDTRRSYTEENTAVAASDYITCLLPNGAGDLTEWDTAYPSGDHYLLVDDPVTDDGSTYVETGTLSDTDRFAMADLGNPGSGYTLDIKLFAVHYKGASQPCDFTCGIRIGSTNYPAYSANPTNGVYTNQSGAVWEENPATSSEWTYSELDSIVTYITTSDASPDVRCTRIGIVVWVNFTATPNYQLDAEITYSSVGETAQTTGYYVICQGYVSGSEWVNVYAYDYVGEEFDLKNIIYGNSDSDFSFALAAENYDSDADEITLKVVGYTETGDTVQDTLYLDILKVKRLEVGYALDIELYTTSAPQYGNLTLRVKGYTSAEPFQLDVYNYSAVGWDTDVHQVTDLSNTWQTTIDLNDSTNRDGQNVKIRFVDTIAETGDTTQDTLYLDVVWLTHYYADPVASNYGADPETQDYGEAIVFFLNYSDADNQAPSYVYLYIDSTDYPLSKNDSGDVSYWNGVNYSLSKSDLDPGEYEYYFKIKDSESDEITTTPDSVTVNAPSNTPANFLTSGITQWQNGTNYQYNAQVEDADSDPITWGLEGNSTSFLGTTPNGYFCLISGTLPSMGWWYVNISADDDGDSIDVTWQNFTLTALNSAPYFTSSPVLSGVVNESYEYQAVALDNNTDTLIYDISESPSGTLAWLNCNATSGLLNGTPTAIGSYVVNMSVTEIGGQGLTVWQNFTIEISAEGETLELMQLIIGLVFCFGLLLAGFKEHAIWILNGPVWIVCGLAIFIHYHELFMFAGIGLGMFTFIGGVYNVWNK